MTAVEEAKYLFEKFYHPSSDSILYGYLTIDTAKQCAIIAVDKILKAFDDFFMIPIKEIKYWQSVKEEILNL